MGDHHGGGNNEGIGHFLNGIIGNGQENDGGRGDVGEIVMRDMQNVVAHVAKRKSKGVARTAPTHNGNFHNAPFRSSPRVGAVRR